MTHHFSMLVLAGVAAFGMSTPSQAADCPATSYPIKLLTLNADGIVTRSVYIRKDIVGKGKNPAGTKFIPVVRDSIKIEHGDLLTLNASPSTVDTRITAEIAIKSQDRNEKGMLLSTTYHVVETTTNSFTAPADNSIRNAYLVTVKNPTDSRSCGEVVKTDLDLESSSDVHQ